MKKQQLRQDNLTYIEFARILRLLLIEPQDYNELVLDFENCMTRGFCDYRFRLRPYSKYVHIVMLEMQAREARVVKRFRLRYGTHPTHLCLSRYLLVEHDDGRVEAFVPTEPSGN